MEWMAGNFALSYERYLSNCACDEMTKCLLIFVAILNQKNLTSSTWTQTKKGLFETVAKGYFDNKIKPLAAK